MLTSKSPIYKLFEQTNDRKMHNMLRSILNHSFSGKTQLQEFIKKENTDKWYDYLVSKYGVTQANNFKNFIESQHPGKKTESHVYCVVERPNQNNQYKAKWTKAMESTLSVLAPDLNNNSTLETIYNLSKLNQDDLYNILYIASTYHLKLSNSP